MSTIKVFSLGGIDKKSNDLTRATDKASDMVNMEYDTQSTLKKRNGFTEQIVDAGSAANFDDIFYYNSKDEIIGVNTGDSSIKVLRRSGSDFITKTIPTPSGIPVWSVNPSISYCENQNNLYFTNTDYSTYVMKYDGDSLIRAGLPTPRISDSTTKIDKYPTWAGSAGPSFSRVFYSYKDLNGNIMYSPYVQYAYGTSLTDITLNSFKEDPNCNENGFFSKFCFVPSSNSIGGSTFTASDATISLYEPGISSIEILQANITSGFGFSTLTSGDILSWGATTATVDSSFPSYVAGVYVGDIYILTSLYTAGPTGPITGSKAAALSAANKTLVVTRHNYVAGDKFLMDTENKFLSIDSTGLSSLILDVESVTNDVTTASFTAVRSGNILTVLTIASGAIAIGSKINGTGVTADTYVVSFLTGSGGLGTYTVTTSQSLSSRAMTQTTSSITFTADSFKSRSISLLSALLAYPIEYPLDIRCKVLIAFSSNETDNYTLSAYVLDNSSITNTINAAVQQQVFYGYGRPSTPTPLADLYDSDYQKLMPPICKYITSYGNQIIYCSIKSYFSGYANINTFPNQRIDFANTSLIIYSDTSVGDSPEGFSGFNLIKVGETWDGDITGARRCNDALIIFKNRGIFSIDGDLVDSQFSLRKINSNFSGCTSHKSIMDADEGTYFQSHNGLYFTNGINASKISYEIDSLFLSGTYLNTRSVRLKKKQKSLFYVPDILSGTYKIVIIDYYYNQIYMWNSATLPASGIIEDKDGNVYFCDGAKLFKFNDSYTDNGTAISCLYSTTWHHAGEPSLNKKWLSLRTFGLTSDAFTATITTEGDWQTGTYLTTNSSVYGATTQTDFKMLDMQTKKALRINFSNSTNNENMILTGYELTYEMFNVVDKN
jgi:hypothetical protein